MKSMQRKVVEHRSDGSCAKIVGNMERIKFLRIINGKILYIKRGDGRISLLYSSNFLPKKDVNSLVHVFKHRFF